MATRTITGPVNTASGTGIGEGSIVIVPLIPAGSTSDGFVVMECTYPITNGVFSASLVVPGRYRFEVLDGDGHKLREFTANVSDAALTPISLREIWESASDPVVFTAAAMREGDSILRLISGSGLDGEILSQNGGQLVWTPLPQAGGLTPYCIVQDSRANGTLGGTFTNGAPRLRVLNTIVNNFSGLSNGALLDTGTSEVILRAPVTGTYRYCIDGWSLASLADAVESFFFVDGVDSGLRFPVAGVSNSDGVNVACRYVGCLDVGPGADPRLSIMQQSQTTVNAVGMGNANALSGRPEIYTHVSIMVQSV
ncbi:MAG: hypothetical protein JST22_16455 [Bacteroidetes bacterium]|nr:hypothetical protein [Bacteroidota bacterium]